MKTIKETKVSFSGYLYDLRPNKLCRSIDPRTPRQTPKHHVIVFSYMSPMLVDRIIAPLAGNGAYFWQLPHGQNPFGLILIIWKDSRGQGSKDSSELLILEKNLILNV